MIRKILVSQPQPVSPKSPYSEIEEEFGVKFTFRPFIRIVGISVNDFRKQRVDIKSHTAVVFTSRHAIDHFFELCKDLRLKMPETMKYFATSESVALYIQKYVQYRKRKVFFGTTGKLDGLLSVMLKHKSEKFLIPQNDTTESSFSKMLNEKGIAHTDTVMFRTENIPVTREELSEYGMVVLFTAAGVQTLTTSYPEFEQGMLRVATLGNAARMAAEKCGLRLDVVAPLPKQPSITGAIAQYLREESERDKQNADVLADADKEQIEKQLRRSVAAKKAAETRQRKQSLTKQMQDLQQELVAKRQDVEECRERTTNLKSEADERKRVMEAAVKDYEEARRLADRAMREGERLRKMMREVEAKIASLVEEMQAMDGGKKQTKATAAAKKSTKTAATKMTKTSTAKSTIKKKATTTKKAK